MRRYVMESGEICKDEHTAAIQQIREVVSVLKHRRRVATIRCSTSCWSLRPHDVNSALSRSHWFGFRMCVVGS